MENINIIMIKYQNYYNAKNNNCSILTISKAGLSTATMNETRTYDSSYNKNNIIHTYLY